MVQTNNLISDILDEASEDFNTLKKIENKFTENESNTETKINNLENSLASKSDIGHNHDDRYYDKDTVESMIETGISGANLEQYATKTNLEEGLAGKSNLGHRHTVSDVEGLNEELNNKINISEAATKVDLAGKSDISHSHDDKYYDKTTVENMIETSISGANLEQYATKIFVTEELLKKTDLGHRHTASDVEGLNESLESKMEVSIGATKKELEEGLATKTDIGHNHNDIYYTQDEVDERIQSGIDSVDLSILATKSELEMGLVTKAELNHNHEIANINGLQTQLDEKINADIAATKSELNQRLDSKADLNHKHDDDYAAKVHNHNDLYFTKEEIDLSLKDSSDATILDAVMKANIYTEAEILKIIGGENEKNITTITGTVNALLEHEQAYIKFQEEMNTSLSGKADLAHKHNISDVNNLDGTLDSIFIEINKKANTTDVYTKSEIDTSLQSKSDIGHNHDDKYSKLNHIHVANEITDLFDDIYNKNEIDTALQGKSDIGHNHDDKYSELNHNHVTNEITDLFNKVYNKDEVNTSLQSKSDIGHNHDDKYSKLDHVHTVDEMTDLFDNIYNKNEIDAALQGKSDIGHNHDDKYSELEHNHVTNEITDLFDEVYNKNEVDTILQGKSDIGHNHNDKYSELNHNHVANEITDLFDNVYNKNEIDTSLQSKSDIGHNHDDKYSELNHNHTADEMTDLFDNVYSKNEIDTALQGKSDIGHNHDDKYSKLNHNHIVDEITDLFDEVYNKDEIDTVLQSKSDIEHGHDISQISELQTILDSKIDKKDATTQNNELRTYIDDQIILAKTEVNGYTDKEILELIDSAPDTMNTLNKIASVVTNNKTSCDQYFNSITSELDAKADIIHTHDGVYAKLEHEHELTDLNGLEDRLGKVQSDAIAQAVVDANTYTESKIKEILGGDNAEGNTVEGISARLTLHEQEFEEYKESTESALEQKSDLNHKHDISRVTGLQDALDLKANTSTVDTMNSNLTKAIDDSRILAETNAKIYTDTAISNLVDSAPEAMNTLNELALAINNHQNVYDAYIADVSTQLAGKSDIGHLHDDRYFTKDEITERIKNIDLTDYALKTDLNNYSPIEHNHNDVYSKLNHTHNASEINDLSNDYYNKTEISNLLNNKSDTTHRHDDVYSELDHTHTCTDVLDLTENYYTKTNTNELLSGKSDISHAHDNQYYRKYMVDAKINALGIDSYAKLDDLTSWAEQFSLKEHTHENMSSSTLISDIELDTILLNIFGINTIQQ